VSGTKIKLVSLGYITHFPNRTGTFPARKKQKPCYLLGAKRDKEISQATFTEQRGVSSERWGRKTDGYVFREDLLCMDGSAWERLALDYQGERDIL